MVHIDLNLARVIHEKWKESILVSRFLACDMIWDACALSDHISPYVLVQMCKIEVSLREQ